MPHYFSEKQPLEDVKKIRVSVKGLSFEVYSGKGVFSKEQLDIGSRILIENCVIEEDWDVLDLGCGIGIVGISLKMIYPNITVTMSEINEAAVKLAMMNIRMHKQNNKVIKSDGFSRINEKFDTILLNPPQTAGKKICNMLITNSKEHLNKSGMLQIVARHNKGGSEFEKVMLSAFGNCTQIVKKSGFRIYLSTV